VTPHSLSVVVTVVDGGDTLRRCLTALTNQESPPALQVIVPFDASISYVGDLLKAYPGVEGPTLGVVETERPLESPAGQHELFDRRRALGLAAATGSIVCILEDRGIPDPDWARSVERLHALPHGVIGGAVECGIDRLLNWAVYFCDFSRYQLPLAAGPREYVTDVNISYKREALERTRHLWEGRYHETTVNWALRREGEVLFLSPEFVVRQHREDLRLGTVLHERLDWGRLFAYTRARECTTARRLVYALLAPVLPVVLLLRHGRAQASKRVRFTTFLKSAPLVFLLLVVWSLGELQGYLTGRG
jgi:hypothetical protein